MNRLINVDLPVRTGPTTPISVSYTHLERVFAIGDSYNDESMLQEAQISFAPANAGPEAVSYTHLDVYKRQRLRCAVTIAAIRL